MLSYLGPCWSCWSCSTSPLGPVGSYVALRSLGTGGCTPLWSARIFEVSDLRVAISETMVAVSLALASKSAGALSSAIMFVRCLSTACSASNLSSILSMTRIRASRSVSISWITRICIRPAAAAPATDTRQPPRVIKVDKSILWSIS